MEKISFVPSLLGKLNNAEHDYLHRICNISINRNIADVEVLRSVIEPYRLLYDQEDKIYKHSRKMPETKQLEDLDKQRDKDFCAFKKQVKHSLESRNNAVREAATKLDYIVDRYKDTDKRPYAEATDFVINMLQDLTVVPYPAALVTIDAADLIADLEQSNTLFNELYMERATNLHEVNSEGKMKEIRLLVDAAFLNLIERLNVIYNASEITGTDPEATAKLKKAVCEISSYIAQAEWVFYQRSSNTKPVPTPEPPVPPNPPVQLQRVAEQRVDDRLHMKVIMSDPDLFTSFLFPGILHGTLEMATMPDWEEIIRFPISGFVLLDQSDPIGFVVESPYEERYFEMPFQANYPPDRVRIVKDEKVIVELTNMMVPLMPI